MRQISCVCVRIILLNKLCKYCIHCFDNSVENPNWLFADGTSAALTSRVSLQNDVIPAAHLLTREKHVNVFHAKVSLFNKIHTHKCICCSSSACDRCAVVKACRLTTTTGRCSANVVLLMGKKRELLCLMLCSRPSSSSATSRATPASSTTEPPPIQPIRAWREGGRRRERERRIACSGEGRKSLHVTLMRPLEDTRRIPLRLENYFLEQGSLYYPPHSNAAHESRKTFNSEKG